MCCDLRDCQSKDSKQWTTNDQTGNCGHSFHTECLRDTCGDLGQSASNADRARLCPICHPLLEDRIRELSTTMNRLVKKKDFEIHQSEAQTVRRLDFYYQKPQIHFPSSLFRYLAGDELNSDDDSDEESDDEDDDDDPDNFEDKTAKSIP